VALLETHGTPGTGRNIPSLVTVLFANAVMTVCQVNIASVYLPISVTFDEQIVGLGILTSLFYVGYGIVEIPGGALGSRLGPRKLALLGLAVCVTSITATGLAPTFDSLIALRFVTGMGLGLFFPAAVVLAVRNLGEGSSGLGAALVVTSFSIGAAAGVFGWSVLSADYGWRLSLVANGAVTMLAALVFYLRIPADSRDPMFRFTREGFKGVVGNRKLQVVSLALFGSGLSGSLPGSFIVYYLEKTFDAQPGLAGLIGGVGYITLLVTAILGGRLFDRGGNPKAIIFGATAALTLGIGIIAFHSVYAAVVGSLICGLSIGPISTVALVIARRTAPSPELETMVVGIADNLSLAGVFVGSLFFPLLVVTLGYPYAWVIGGVAGLILTVPVLLIKEL
jgi:predicted MFS family arabinose efflux permease